MFSQHSPVPMAWNNTNATLQWSHPTPVPKPQTQQKPDHLSEAFALARRCVGISPITAKDIEKNIRMLEPNLDKETKFQIAGKRAVLSFLEMELAMSPREVNNLSIEGVFYSPTKTDLKTLYV